MKNLLMGALLLAATQTAMAQDRKGAAPGTEEWARSTCKNFVAEQDSKIVKLKKQIQDIELTQEDYKKQVIYPTIINAYQWFQSQIPSLSKLISQEAKDWAQKYNNAYAQLKASGNDDSDSVKELVASEIHKEYGSSLMALIKRDFASLEASWVNGSWVTFGDLANGFAVSYASTQEAPALTIKFVRLMNNEIASVHIEFRYNPFTGEIRPKELTAAAGIEEAIKSNWEKGIAADDLLDFFYVLRTKKQLDQVRRELKDLEEDGKYKGCKALINK